MGLLFVVHGGLMTRFSVQLAAYDRSMVEFEARLRLARSPEQRLRMTDLAAQALLTTSGVTRVVDRLERDGLVYRLACPTDRRSSYTVISDDGLARLCTVL